MLLSPRTHAIGAIEYQIIDECASLSFESRTFGEEIEFLFLLFLFTRERWELYYAAFSLFEFVRNGDCRYVWDFFPLVIQKQGH